MNRWWGASLLVVAGLLAVAVLHQMRDKAAAPESGPGAAAESRPGRDEPRVRIVDYDARNAPTGEAAAVRRVRADEVLAKVNGVPIRLPDLVPVSDDPKLEYQDLPEDVFAYLLDRAITRTLILQEAGKRGIELAADQEVRLATLREQRSEGGPGLVRSVNSNAASLDFELQDTEAFMLQANMMEAAGASPNVSSAEVLEYYDQHAGEFGELPQDPDARGAAWQEIDAKIRHRLAAGVRADYNRLLAARMEELKSGADIQVFPPEIR